jgi:hypothetical protein
VKKRAQSKENQFKITYLKKVLPDLKEKYILLTLKILRYALIVIQKWNKKKNKILEE